MKLSEKITELRKSIGMVNMVKEKQSEIFEGVLIKESVSDENIIDFLNVHKIELEIVCSECRKMGISDEQMNWAE